MRLNEIENYSVYADPIYKQYKTAIDFAINKYVTTGAAIYKGSRNYDRQKLAMRDPMSFPDPRRSKNTLNYYTEWVDNSPFWSQFPKRSRSLICSSDKVYASNFGQTAVVVPTVDTTVGICPDDDWWNSFNETSPQNDPNEINQFVHDVLKSKGIYLNGKTVKYNEFAQHLKDVDLEKYDAYSFTEDLKIQAMELGGMIELMDHVFNPAANGFNLTTWKQFDTTGEHEVWLSASCVIVPIEIWKQLIAKGTLDATA